MVDVSATYTLPQGIGSLILTGTAAISGTGNGQNDYLYTNSSGDSLVGGTADDTLIAGESSSGDALVAGSGPDVLTSEGDYNSLVSGSGIDTLGDYNNGAESTIYINNSQDVLTAVGAYTEIVTSVSYTIAPHVGVLFDRRHLAAGRRLRQSCGCRR